MGTDPLGPKTLYLEHELHGLAEELLTASGRVGVDDLRLKWLQLEIAIGHLTMLMRWSMVDRVSVLAL